MSFKELPVLHWMTSRLISNIQNGGKRNDYSRMLCTCLTFNFTLASNMCTVVRRYDCLMDGMPGIFTTFCPDKIYEGERDRERERLPFPSLLL
jgi:hypothetical protein